MIVAKLLSVKVQPVFVLVDTDTADVTPAPAVAPADLTGAQLGQLGDMIEQARQQLEQQIAAQTGDASGLAAH